MELLNLAENHIVFVLGVMGIIFGIYKYFHDPQVKADKEDALMSQQFKSFVETTDRRFHDMKNSITELQLQSNTHGNTVDIKFNNLNTNMAEMGKQIIKLTTIIDERIPKK